LESFSGQRLSHGEPNDWTFGESGGSLARMDLLQAIDVVKESTFKLTRARQAILEAIFHAKGPFSANSLDARLQTRSERHSADVVTIYRNLSIFEDLKIISRCDFSDDEAMYEVIHGEHGHHHHHIVCQSCKRIDPLEFCIVEGQEQILEKLGYQNLSHRLEFSGLCPACSVATKKNSRRTGARNS